MEKLLKKTKSGITREEYIEVKPNIRLLITVAGIGRTISFCVLLFALSACNKTPELQSDRPANFTDKQWLGKQLFFDTNLSEPAGLACAGCHAPQVGWTG